MNRPPMSFARSARPCRRRYKIQDVNPAPAGSSGARSCKEERGNKGAALTTYLSLAGRYCVLMPNYQPRRRHFAQDFQRRRPQAAEVHHDGPEAPLDHGLIVRTAGLSRTKVEIKRDFDYLARSGTRSASGHLSSTAPALIYRDSDLIKRAIRDLYHREIEEVIVEGEEGYKAARGFMKLLDAEPRAPREAAQRDHAAVPALRRRGPARAMYQPIVQLKSGGYLVINPTEALVSIDINSGPLDPRAQYRADRLQHQPRGRARDRPPAAPARHGRPHRHRLHRHGADRAMSARSRKR
jgi:ribonuclease E